MWESRGRGCSECVRLTKKTERKSKVVNLSVCKEGWVFVSKSVCETKKSSETGVEAENWGSPHATAAG